MRFWITLSTFRCFSSIAWPERLGDALLVPRCCCSVCCVFARDATDEMLALWWCSVAGSVVLGLLVALGTEGVMLRTGTAGRGTAFTHIHAE